MADDETKGSTESVEKADEGSKEKRGRGRPKKSDSAKKPQSSGKRGRPPKPDSEKKSKAAKEGSGRGRPRSENYKPKTHPPVSEMVTAATAALKDRRGCSLSAVKKYIASNYKVDMERQVIFIRRYVRKAIESGQLTLVKGTSTTGSFKLADPSDARKPAKKLGSGKRGRPRGSKNKPSKEKASKEDKERTKSPGKRGRPKGSKKAKKDA